MGYIDMISANTRVTGIFGHPISHSLSPQIHNLWLAQTNCDAVYLAFPVEDERADVKMLLEGLHIAGIVGLSVTAPFKEQALALAVEADPMAQKIGAANCLKRTARGWKAFNTDAQGFLDGLEQFCVAEQVDFASLRRARILGAGGAARALVAGLRSRHIETEIVARTQARAEAIAADFGSSIRVWAQADHELSAVDLLINATPLGLQGQTSLPFDFRSARADLVVCDTIYRPQETDFMRRARIHCRHVQGGLDMLIHQAAYSFQLWWQPPALLGQTQLDAAYDLSRSILARSV